MHEKNDKVFYVNLIDGIVQEGKFIEYDNDGMWVRLKGQTINTFVYSSDEHARLYKALSDAEEGLLAARSSIKNRLLKNNKFIDDIIKKLSKQEGSFYTGIIKEILCEKTK